MIVRLNHPERMSGKFHHIVGAKGTGEPNPEDSEDQYLFRTSTWTLAEAPDDPSVIAVFAMTAAGQIGLEFPKSEARELARQLGAMTKQALGEKQ